MVHIDLYFFFDVDVVMLNVEVGADDLTLAQAQEMLYRFGRAYPAGWDAQARPCTAMASVEWLGADGQVLARSDAQQREAFLAHVCEHRAPRIAAHWAFVLEPLVPDHSTSAGPLRYRQIEYYRMPLMAYLALDDPRALTRNDFIRLGLVTGAARQPTPALPFAEQHLADFEQRYCYDRFWADAGAAPQHALPVQRPRAGRGGRCALEFYALPRPRRAGAVPPPALHAVPDRAFPEGGAADVLRPAGRGAEAARRRRRRERASASSARSAPASRASCASRTATGSTRCRSRRRCGRCSHLCATHLGLDPLYAEVKERIADMNAYLDADSLRRQANTVVRLTVVTIFGLIGTVTTGFLGMNLLAEADAPLCDASALCSASCSSATTALTIYTMAKSKRLSDFLDALSDERLSAWMKLKSLAAVWLRKGD